MPTLIRILSFKNRNFFSHNRILKTSTVGILNEHLIDYPSPSNINYFWSFGALAGIFLTIQIISGIILAMHYTPHMDYAFISVEHIMRNVNNGFIIRYIHSNGASFFFILTFLHIGKNLYYKAYSGFRLNLWYSGLIIFILMMATAFFGYMLPWGQMSYWGATVITNLFTAIPYFGMDLAEWLWGGYSISNPTLNRFYSFHYLCPFLIAGLVLLHLHLLHLNGSTNPLHVYYSVDKISFYPYFYLKDLFIILIILFIFVFIVFFEPNLFSDPENYIPADSEHTPHHLVPEWYFLPFYAILRGIENKLGGFIAMGASLVIFFIIPLLDKETVNYTRYSFLYGFIFFLFIFTFVTLGWLGNKQLSYPYTILLTYYSLQYFLSVILLTYPLFKSKSLDFGIKKYFFNGQNSKRRPLKSKFSDLLLIVGFMQNTQMLYLKLNINIEVVSILFFAWLSFMVIMFLDRLNLSNSLLLFTWVINCIMSVQLYQVLGSYYSAYDFLIHYLLLTPWIFIYYLFWLFSK